MRMRLGLLLAGAAVAAAALAAPAAAQASVTQYSGTFAGYADGGGYRYVSAGFQVPVLNCGASPANSWAAFWAGLEPGGGVAAQAGVWEYCDSYRQPHYIGWWWMVPSGAHYEIWVRGGDWVTASVWFHPYLRNYYVKLADWSLGRTIASTQGCPWQGCGGYWAEVMTERAGNGLPDFGHVNFSGAWVTTYGGYSRGLYGQYRYVMTGAYGRVLASPGGLWSYGHNYTTWWERSS